MIDRTVLEGWAAEIGTELAAARTERDAANEMLAESLIAHDAARFALQQSNAALATLAAPPAFALAGRCRVFDEAVRSAGNLVASTQAEISAISARIGDLEQAIAEIEKLMPAPAAAAEEEQADAVG